MKPEAIIEEYGLHEARESSMVRPEAIPANLLHIP